MAALLAGEVWIGLPVLPAFFVKGSQAPREKARMIQALPEVEAGAPFQG